LLVQEESDVRCIARYGLTKSYGTRRAADGVSFQVRAGQTIGLLGPDGAGKSTTVGMLCGLLRLDAGQVSSRVGNAMYPDRLRSRSGARLATICLWCSATC
jgi:ABC-type multidrug transport system ATPase subunit